MYNGSLRGGGDGKPYLLSGTSGTGVVDDWSSGVKYGAPSASRGYILASVWNVEKESKGIVS
jgi:hypothetical protein